MSSFVAHNLARLMAERSLSIAETVRRTGVDRRTLRAVLEGTTTPHSRTVQAIAEGLGVSVEEFWIEPPRGEPPIPPKRLSAAVADFAEKRPELFRHWDAADWDELERRLACKSEPPADAIWAAVHDLNHKRRQLQTCAILLEMGDGAAMSQAIDAVARLAVGDRLNQYLRRAWKSRLA